jgi:hypothetical protein
MRGIGQALTGIASVALLAMLGAGSTILDAAQPGAPQVAAAEPSPRGGSAVIRRLNETQYRRAIEDVFGPGITVPGRFDPRLREAGLLAIGDSKVAVSASGFEQSELRARQIAGEIMSEKRRSWYLACTPAGGAFDPACATTFVTSYGRQLYRRPLTRQETAAIVGLAGTATAKSGSFYKGMEVALSRMLASPYFIFRIEQAVPDMSAAAGARLDDYSLASRLSYLLWDGAPDAELLNAAASGALRTDVGLQRQADRLLASPRFADGVRAFFSDMLGYEQFDGLSKEQALYPKFTSQLAKDAREQALRTIVDLLVTQNGDYRDLFTTKKTFINRNLASLYKVPAPFAVDGWAPYEFAANDPRAGLLTFAAFLMLDPSHEGRSSPTIRGKAVREMLMCEMVPTPPANVDFSIVQNTGDQVHKTARERLTLHQENPVCAGCHKITDPIGLSLENYDAVGQYREQENGAVIDASGLFEGKAYRNGLHLTSFLRDSPAVSSCVVQRAFEYGSGQPLADENWLTYASGRFAGANSRLPQLMRFIATSKAFREVAPGSRGTNTATATPGGARRQS